MVDQILEEDTASFSEQEKKEATEESSSDSDEFDLASIVKTKSIKKRHKGLLLEVKSQVDAAGNLMNMAMVTPKDIYKQKLKLRQQEKEFRMERLKKMTDELNQFKR